MLAIATDYERLARRAEFTEAQAAVTSPDIYAAQLGIAGDWSPTPMGADSFGTNRTLHLAGR
jgi:hypothetical protein